MSNSAILHGITPHAAYNRRIEGYDYSSTKPKKTILKRPKAVFDKPQEPVDLPLPISPKPVRPVLHPKFKP